MLDQKETRKVVLARLAAIGLDNLPAGVVDALVVDVEAKVQKAIEGAVTPASVVTKFTAYAKTAKGPGASPAPAGAGGSPKATPAGKPAPAAAK